MTTYKIINANLVLRDDGMTIALPVSESEGFKYQLWLEEGNVPEPADPAPLPDYSAMRAQAYRDESDPLFFKSQRGKATTQEWLDKVAEIKARWPE